MLLKRVGLSNEVESNFERWVEATKGEMTRISSAHAYFLQEVRNVFLLIEDNAIRKKSQLNTKKK